MECSEAATQDRPARITGASQPRPFTRPGARHRVAFGRHSVRGRLRRRVSADLLDALSAHLDRPVWPTLLDLADLGGRAAVVLREDQPVAPQRPLAAAALRAGIEGLIAGEDVPAPRAHGHRRAHGLLPTAARSGPTPGRGISPRRALRRGQTLSGNAETAGPRAVPWLDDRGHGRGVGDGDAPPMGGELRTMQGGVEGLGALRHPDLVGAQLGLGSEARAQDRGDGTAMPRRRRMP